MSEDLHKNIFSGPTGDPPGPEKLESYFKGELSERERHEIEKYLLEDDLTAEALEGLGEEINSENTQAAVADITGRAWNRVGELQKKKRRGAVTWTSIAAGIILLIVGGWFFISRSEENKMDKVFAENFEVFPSEGSRQPSSEKTTEESEALEGEDLFASADEASDDTDGKSRPPAAPDLKQSLPPKALDRRGEEDKKALEEAPLDLLNDMAVVEEVYERSEEAAPEEEETVDFEVADDFAFGSNEGIKSDMDNNRMLNKEELKKPDPMVAGDTETMMGGVDKNEIAAVTVTREKGKVSNEANRSTSLDGAMQRTAGKDMGGVEELEKGEFEDDVELDEVVVADVKVQSTQRKDRTGKFKRAKKSEARNAPGVVANEPARDQGGRQWYKEGMDSYRSQDYKAASGELEEAGKLDPDNMDAWFYAGVSRLSNEEARAALKNLEKIKPSNPRYEDALWYRALGHIKLKEKKKAKKLLVKLQKSERYQEKATKTLNSF